MKSSYGAKSIRVLEGLEPVRERPGMYIGSTGPAGLHHLVYEVVDNSIDEAGAGYCTMITIEHGADGSITVTDDGRGIPVELHPTEGVSALQVVLTKLHAGGKFDETAYGSSGGLHGVGISVVNALSEKLIATVWRGKHQYRQTYSKGIPQTPVVKTASLLTPPGTRIQFYPDPTVFETVEFDSSIIMTRLRELSYLNPGLCIRFINPNGKITVYESDRGLADYIESINSDSSISEIIELTGQVDTIHCSIALRWTKSSAEEVRSFCNNITTAEGGTHLTGFRSGLSRAVLKSMAELFPKNMETPTGDDIREGLVAIVSVRVPQPQFEGQTKAKLGTSAAKGATESITNQKLQEYFSSIKKEDLKKIADRIINSTRARMAASRARDNARKSANLTEDTLPGKLTDCQSQDPAERELFLCEGDSAGGSAKQARDRKFQAILPLKGKILNTEKAALKTILSNAEIQTIIAAIGTGVGASSFDLKKLRYHKIIIMTDADVDGAHISTLLLTLFFRHMPEIILNGNLYIAQSPLFRIKAGKSVVWVYHENKLAEALAPFKERGMTPVISRFKGLGEMPPELLWETTMDPEKRTLIKVEITDRHCDEMFQILMGDDAERRCAFINENATLASIDI